MTGIKKALNLYAGICGNRKKWEGVHVTNVERNEELANLIKVLHPEDETIVADAHKFLLEHHSAFDFIWSSPPCQSNSSMMKFTKHKLNKYPDLRLYEEIIFLRNFYKGRFVVENVEPYYEPLIQPSVKIGRHLLWSNFKINSIHVEKPEGVFMKLQTTKQKKIMMDWLGIHFEKNIYYEGNHCPVQVLRNAVHPKIGKHVFDCALKDIAKEALINAVNQLNLFEK